MGFKVLRRLRVDWTYDGGMLFVKFVVNCSHVVVELHSSQDEFVQGVRRPCAVMVAGMNPRMRVSTKY